MKILKAGGHLPLTPDEATAATVRQVLDDIRGNGLEAIREYSRRFDSWDPADFELSPDDIRQASAQLPESLKSDIEFCQTQVREFAKKQLETLLPLEVETLPGVTLGQKHIPVRYVGCYVPGGRYPAFASAYMSVITAKTAGVGSVIACTPPVAGKWNPVTVHTIHTSGADRIFCLGGIQAMGLMAFGKEGLPPVDMLVGPGNRFIIEAKRQLFGQVGIDLIAGPTEILVLADDSADAALVACDLLGQAEHDPNSGICLVCTSEEKARQVMAEVEKQLVTLPSREIAAQSWENNGIVLVADDADEAISLADDYAPEHLELQVANIEYYFRRLRNYGSLFIGEETTVAYGDKSSGTNHILPTGRAARYTGGMSVFKFLKTVTYQRMTPQASHDIAGVTERICRAEGMLAHALTAAAREARYS